MLNNNLIVIMPIKYTHLICIFCEKVLLVYNYYLYYFSKYIKYLNLKPVFKIPTLTTSTTICILTIKYRNSINLKDAFEIFSK